MSDLLQSNDIATFQEGTANLQSQLMNQISNDNCNTFRE